MFNFGQFSFMYKASKMFKRRPSGHPSIISVFSSRIFLVIVMPCSSFRCLLGAPAAKCIVIRRESFVVVMPI